MTKGWYKYSAMNAFYKVEGDGNEGRGFRWFVDPKQTKLEFFTFEDRTASFIKEALATGQVVECTQLEYLTELQKFLKWQNTALLALDKALDGLKEAA
jgi:hypothetical protein